MAKKITSKKKNKKKTGYIGEEIWLAHRLEGVVKNKSTKHIKKAKVIRAKKLIRRVDNPDKVHKNKIEDIDIMIK